ncbi:hypothetical protein [Nocardia sp. NPDC050406]|uniref:hypothetical protein n=1 Tax=Nocardia sp. NPDC050406 TaxID=3364318 RepID=UPI0037B728DC
MEIKRFAATAALAFCATAFTVGIANADPGVSGGDVAGISVQDENARVDVATPEDDLAMRQCNAVIGALVGGVIGGTGSALPGALIGAGIGAAVGWTLNYPPGPPLACWQPSQDGNPPS